MTDHTGILQHAIYTVPNYQEGYTTDDNARAFILTVLLGELGEDVEQVRTLGRLMQLFCTMRSIGRHSASTIS